jgi:hypothetical protein
LLTFSACSCSSQACVVEKQLSDTFGQQWRGDLVCRRQRTAASEVPTLLRTPRRRFVFTIQPHGDQPRGLKQWRSLASQNNEKAEFTRRPVFQREITTKLRQVRPRTIQRSPHGRKPCALRPSRPAHRLPSWRKPITELPDA